MWRARLQAGVGRQIPDDGGKRDGSWSMSLQSTTMPEDQVARIGRRRSQAKDETQWFPVVSVGSTSEVRGPNNVILWFKVTEFAQNLAYLAHIGLPRIFPSIIARGFFLNLPCL